MIIVREIPLVSDTWLEIYAKQLLCMVPLMQAAQTINQPCISLFRRDIVSILVCTSQISLLDIEIYAAINPIIGLKWYG